RSCLQSSTWRPKGEWCFSPLGHGLPPRGVDAPGNGGRGVVRRAGEDEGGEVEVVGSAVGVPADGEGLTRVVAVEPQPSVVAERSETGGPARADGGTEVEPAVRQYPQVVRGRTPVPQAGQFQQRGVDGGRTPFGGQRR